MATTCPAATSALVLVSLLATGGCAHHLGPKTIVNDRFDYGSNLADSWKEQTLLNIVKLRYLDTPIFLDVGQIVSGYTLETGISVGGTISTPGAIQGDFGSLGATGRYTDRPTITYSPMTGEKFLRGLITPLPARAVFFLIQSGFAADFVFELTTESINGIRNTPVSLRKQRGADPEFLRVIELMEEVQASGSLAMLVEPGEKGAEAMVVTFLRGNSSEETRLHIEEIRQLLGLPPGIANHKVINSPVNSGDGTLAVDTRSVLQMLLALSLQVELPEGHVSQKRAVPGLPPAAPGSRSLFHVSSGPDKPSDAYAAVRYRDTWFWIDDTDLRSKRTFAFIMFIFTLADTGSPENRPVLTIPTN